MTWQLKKKNNRTVIEGKKAAELLFLYAFIGKGTAQEGRGLNLIEIKHKSCH